MKKTNPRHCAYSILTSFASGTIVTDFLGDSLAALPLSAEDRRLAYELVCGVIRRCGSLDTIIRWLASDPSKKIDDEVITILRLGLYQLRYLDKVPPFAAVNESVALARQVGMSRAAGFINAMLRSYGRSRAQIDRNAQRLDENASMAFRESHPEWFIKRLRGQLSSEEIDLFCRFNNTRPTLVLRVNTHRTSAEELYARLKTKNIACEPSPHHEDCIRLGSGIAVQDIPGYDDGLFFVQDETPARLVDLLPLGEHSSVLDACAAPGGKTVAVRMKASAMNVTAIDITKKKIALLNTSVERLQLSNITTFIADSSKQGSLRACLDSQQFDAVIVDAPCSNTGVLRKRLEARWRLSESDFSRLNALQYSIVETVQERVRLNGHLLYMTCSVDPEENTDLIKKFLRTHSHFMLRTEQLFLPGIHTDADGGYGALLQRIV